VADGGADDPVSDRVAARLAELPGTPVGEHVVAYDEVHRMLQDALDRLDEG
jgi:hypothetical protein